MTIYTFLWFILLLACGYCTWFTVYNLNYDESEEELWMEFWKSKPLRTTARQQYFNAVCSVILSMVTLAVGFYMYCYEILINFWRKRRRRKSSRNSKTIFTVSLILTVLMSAVLLVRAQAMESYSNKEFQLLSVITVMCALSTQLPIPVDTLGVLLKRILYVLFLISIPWEYFRLYQNQVAKQISETAAGMPVDCIPNQRTFWSTLSVWTRETFSWQPENSCLKYHTAMLVEPLWEVTPIMALTSLITRSLLTPVELAASATGASLRSLFLHVPLQWQAVVMLQLILLTTLVTLMLCRYKVIIPWVVRLEPHTRPAHTSAVSADTARAHKSICG